MTEYRSVIEIKQFAEIYQKMNVFQRICYHHYVTRHPKREGFSANTKFAERKVEESIQKVRVSADLCEAFLKKRRKDLLRVFKTFKRVLFCKKSWNDTTKRQNKPDCAATNLRSNAGRTMSLKPPTDHQNMSKRFWGLARRCTCKKI